MSDTQPGEIRVSPDSTEIGWYQPEDDGDDRPWLILERGDADIEPEWGWMSAAYVAGWRIVGTSEPLAQQIRDTPTGKPPVGDA